MRRDFVANVSHELRTPLTPFWGSSRRCAGAAKDDPAARDRFLSIMEDEARRMNRLVSDLLSLSRVEAAERMRPSDLVDIGAVLKGTVAAMRPTAELSGNEIVFSSAIGSDGEGTEARGLIHRRSRSADAGVPEPHRKRAEIRRAEPAGRPVADARGWQRQPQGQGHPRRRDRPGRRVDPQHVPRLTERFYRVDTHRSRAMGGTGLGLAIVKHIVNRHRGRLRITSEKGKGSTFSVLFPEA
jgi:two-component system phosphate regulon sensor histidine kinase PhoR